MTKFLNLCVTIIGVFVAALSVSLAWKWFITPLGVPAITTPHALGIMTIPGLMTMKDPKKRSKMDEDDSEKWLYTTLCNLVALLLAYVIHKMM